MIIRKIGTVVAAASLLATTMTPVFAEDITLKGNGSGSESTVIVADVQVAAVEQKNITEVNTVVFNVTNTGGNEVKDNTGAGTTELTSGDVKNKTKVTVTESDNTTTLPDPCGCEPTFADIKISGNGKNTDNTVAVVSADLAFVEQVNVTKVNTVAVNATNTGKNKLNNNTGKGNKTLTSGKVKNVTKVKVQAGTNTVH